VIPDINLDMVGFREWCGEPCVRLTCRYTSCLPVRLYNVRVFVHVFFAS
jgi:hypothetical protein